MSHDLMKSVHRVDNDCRELGHSMQEILVKVEYVKEFAMNSDGKLLEINKMIDDLRYGL